MESGADRNRGDSQAVAIKLSFTVPLVKKHSKNGPNKPIQLCRLLVYGINQKTITRCIDKLVDDMKVFLQYSINNINYCGGMLSEQLSCFDSIRNRQMKAQGVHSGIT